VAPGHPVLHQAGDIVLANDQRRDSVRVIPQPPGEEPLSVVPVSFLLGNPNPSPFGPQPAGRYTAAWHGTDESGNPVVRGVYYCRLVTDGLTAVRKLVKVE
jgi:hypothetical protein